MAFNRGSVEEKRNKKAALKYVIYTIIAGILLFFFGIPLLGRFAAFISDFRKVGAPITSNDSTPPAPPKVDNLPEFTNQKEIKLTGKSEEGATVKLTFNGKEEEVVVGGDGSYSFDLTLRGGANEFDLVAVDTSGNEGQRSKVYTITYDNKAPDLTIDSPENGKEFFGSQQRQIEIKGTTDSGSEITVNDRFVSVDEDGSFQYTTSLNEGENKFLVKSTDKAGNTSESELTLNFTP